MSQKYVLQFKIEGDSDAGTKAVQDCESILLKEGYSPFEISFCEGKWKFWNKIKNFLKYLKLIKIAKGSVLLLQHPQYVNPIYMKFISLLKNKKQCKIILLIHDIESLRKLFVENADQFIKLDQVAFEISDAIIAHNSRMIEYLTQERKITEDKMINLGLFDYLLQDKESRIEVGEENNIVIAGNLDKNKAGYVYQLNSLQSNLYFNLYGVNFAEDQADAHLIYKGKYSPEELPYKLEGKYGLVWDGDSVLSCTGTTGNYVRYNNPHKVSLYIAANLPIIIWEEAALAEFIVKNHLGITVKNLDELQEKIRGISPLEYKKMKESLSVFSSKIRKGEFLKEAIKEAEKLL